MPANRKMHDGDVDVVEQTGEVAARPGRRVAGQDFAKRQQIMAGAKRCFLKLGFEAASMSDIAAEAGVSKGTLYVYFESKERLFSVIVDEPVFSQLNVLGTVTINAATLNVTQITAGAFHESYIIINNDNADSVLGTFTVFTGDFTGNYDISYNSGGNEVILRQIV